MFKIGELSRLTRVSIRMLRHYDEQGLLKPAMVGEWNGYRLYRASQVGDVLKIVQLRDLGFSVMEIKQGLNDPVTLTELLKKRGEAIRKDILVNESRLERIAALLEEETGSGGQPGLMDVRVVSVPEQVGVGLRGTVPTYFHEADLWQRLEDCLAKAGLDLSTTTPWLAVCHDEGIKERDVDLEVVYFPKEPNQICRACPALSLVTLPGVDLMASLMVYGPYENLAPAYGRFARWMEVNPGYRLQEISREIYHVGPWTEGEPERFVTEIQMPLLKNA